MKILLISLGVIFIAFIIIQIFAMSGQRNIENYPYKVVKKYDNFEIRNYEATLFTSVKLNSKEYKEASSRGFSILAGYIFGKNDRSEKISMTSPVAMSLEDSMTMMFMVPRNLSKDDLPTPNDTQIKFQEVPAKTVSSITFGGWADNEKIEEFKQKLISALNSERMPYTNHFYFLGYNPPYEVINRKNEIIVELTKTL